MRPAQLSAPPAFPSTPLAENPELHLLEESDATELDRVEIRAAVEKRRSRAVAERPGCREEGRLSEAEPVGERFLGQVVYVRRKAVRSRLTQRGCGLQR